MVLVFFIYGLSFFLLGTVILAQARRDSGFWVERHLWLLAGFGLLHGLNEWLDMFLLLGSAQWGESGVKAIEVFRFFVGQVSYVFLLQFGVTLVLHGRNRCTWCPRATLAVCALFILGFAVRGWLCRFNKHWFLTSDITMRYLIAFPGAALTGAGFFLERRNPEIKRLDAPAVRGGLAGCLQVVNGSIGLVTGLLHSAAQQLDLPSWVLSHGSALKQLPSQIQLALLQSLQRIPQRGRQAFFGAIDALLHADGRLQQLCISRVAFKNGDGFGGARVIRCPLARLDQCVACRFGIAVAPLAPSEPPPGVA